MFCQIIFDSRWKRSSVSASEYLQEDEGVHEPNAQQVQHLLVLLINYK